MDPYGAMFLVLNADDCPGEFQRNVITLRTISPRLDFFTSISMRYCLDTVMNPGRNLGMLDQVLRQFIGAQMFE